MLLIYFNILLQDLSIFLSFEIEYLVNFVKLIWQVFDRFFLYFCVDIFSRQLRQDIWGFKGFEFSIYFFTGLLLVDIWFFFSRDILLFWLFFDVDDWIIFTDRFRFYRLKIKRKETHFIFIFERINLLNYLIFFIY